MATKEKLLTLFYYALAPITAKMIAAHINEPISNFQTQLDRFQQNGLIEHKFNAWVITEKGKQEFTNSQLGIEPNFESEYINNARRLENFFGSLDLLVKEFGKLREENQLLKESIKGWATKVSKLESLLKQKD